MKSKKLKKSDVKILKEQFTAKKTRKKKLSELEAINQDLIIPPAKDEEKKKKEEE